MEKFGSGIRDKHPGSATLATNFCVSDPELYHRAWVRICFLQCSGSGAFHRQAKVVRTLLISTVSWLFYDFLSVQNDAKFIVSDWGDKVDFGIGLSYRPTRLHRRACRYDNPMPESTGTPIQGLRLATRSRSGSVLEYQGFGILVSLLLIFMPKLSFDVLRYLFLPKSSY